jgi:hypothetical protein
MSMQLKKIMTPEVERIHKDASVRNMAQRMKVIDAARRRSTTATAWGDDYGS